MLPLEHPGEALANREVFWRLSQFKAQRVGVDCLMIYDWHYDNDQHYDYHVACGLENVIFFSIELYEAIVFMMGCSWKWRNGR